MWDKRFAIIDIETTGGSYRTDKITEIGIIIFEKGKIIDSYETLINPERTIPYEITRITGISNDMVADSPKFFEVAKDIIQFIENCVFVAHNVQFDYSFLKEEFRQLGYTFSKQRLCTVQLSRRYFPGLHSYSLGNLISYFQIDVEKRHRAMDDVKATTIIFEKIFLHIRMNEHQDKKLNSLFKENRFPAKIPIEKINALPETNGVYFLLSNKGEAIYIGKSKNIKDRIFQHFNDTGRKTEKMLFLTEDIDFIETGSELMACLIESEEIKKHQPEINKAQRRRIEAYAVYQSTDSNGYKILQIGKRENLPKDAKVISYLSTQKAANEYLHFLIDQYKLCININSGVKPMKPCNGVKFMSCLGACTNMESPQEYNVRFDEMENKLNCIFQKDMLLTDIGRSISEKSVIIIRNGFCARIGYIPIEEQISQYEALEEYTRPYSGNTETNKIIMQFLKKQAWIERKILPSIAEQV